MRAPKAAPEEQEREPVREAVALSGLREGEEDDRNPTEIDGVLDGGFRDLEELVVVVAEKEVAAAAAIFLLAFGALKM